MRLVLLIFLSLPFGLCAQRNLQPGYRINAQGDSIPGFIDQQEWDRTPATFLFATTANGAGATTYSVADAQGFGLRGGPLFRRFTVRISQGTVELNELKEKDTTTTEASVFLQLITQGNLLSLYTYADAIKRRFFMQEEGGALPVELIYREYLLPTDRTKLMKDQVFRGQLKGVMYARARYTQKLAGEIDGAFYTAGDLSKVVAAINQSTSVQTTRRKSYLFFVAAGIQRSVVDFAGNQFFARNSTTTSDLQPVFSGGIDLLANADIGRVVVRFEVGYKTNKSVTVGSSGNNTRSTYTLKSSGLFIAPQFIYNVYNTARIKLYAAGGFSYHILSYQTNQLNEYYISQSLQGPVKENYFKLSKNIFSPLLRAGVVLNKRVELALVVQPPSSLTAFRNYSVSMGWQQLHVSYRFISGR